MSTVSIVVPVYKVEKYLERCVVSLQNQTLKEIEIILVDDGSPDRCPAMCDAMAEKDSRIKVVHKQNGGLSSARNAGLAVASGDYIGFVDSDDDVKPDMYEKMLCSAQLEQVDFVMSDYLRCPAEGSPYPVTTELSGGRYDKAAIREKIFPDLIMRENLEYGPLLSVWHCLYRTGFLRSNHITFDEEVRWSEDNIFSAIVGYRADSFFYLKNEALYHYYQNPGTITTAYRPGAFDVYCTMNRHLHSFFDSAADYDFQRQLKLHMIFYACNCIRQAAALPEEAALADFKKILGSAALKDAFSGFALPETGIKLKMQLRLMKYGFARTLYRMISR